MADTNFDVDQGSDFRFDCAATDSTGAPVDLTGAAIVGYVRERASSRNVQAIFNVIPVDLALGQFAITLTSTQTSKLEVDRSYTAYRTITQLAYDVEVHYAGGPVVRVLQGVLNVSPEVTR